MPHLFSFAHGDDSSASQEMEHELPHKHPRRRPSFLKNIGSLLRRHHDPHGADPIPQTAPTEQPGEPDYFAPTRRRSLQDSSTSARKAIPSLPRPQTFRRQQSEQREKLLEVPPSPTERRALSADNRKRAFSAGSPQRFVPFSSLSAPEVNKPDQPQRYQSLDEQTPKSDAQRSPRVPPVLPPLQIPSQTDGGLDVGDEGEDCEIDPSVLQAEYDSRWILNLSMHFRDKSNREKFFVTYAEKANKWRRVTVSLDYRDAPEGSLEADLCTLHYQRDKSFRIYEAIRESLPEIQYYDTVTNLKLETTAADGQLHVHVHEDANEIIPYPAISLFQHVHARRFRESQLEFCQHLSGFVYKVLANGNVVIKKEIPGPDAVDEFLYEVNALDALLGCDHVTQLEGLVTDDSGSVVKGLLINYASQGAIVDMLYDFRCTPELPWHRREKWAKQIVQGLADVHEAGFVQGDFTLSNIVIDSEDSAQIIDINRRGCPVGWEPPEFGRLIDSGQRIGMCIGVKTDLFQLGMVLWALATEDDEPERAERPLHRLDAPIPSYYRAIVECCLSERPRGRREARQLLSMFPATAGLPPSAGRPSVDFTENVNIMGDSLSTHRSDKEYIDPKYAVTIDEVRRRRSPTGASDFTSGQVTYLDPESNPASTSYRFDSTGSWDLVERRGRSPVSSRRRRSSPFGRTASSATSLSSQSPGKRLQRGPLRNSSKGVDAEGAEERTAYPRTISDEDVRQRADGDKPDAGAASEQNHALNRRLDGLRNDRYTQLLHTDSGFDERMVEDLAVDEGVPDAVVKAAASPPEELPSPGSYYTPAATPSEEVAEQKETS